MKIKTFNAFLQLENNLGNIVKLTETIINDDNFCDGGRMLNLRNYIISEIDAIKKLRIEHQQKIEQSTGDEF